MSCVVTLLGITESFDQLIRAMQIGFEQLMLSWETSVWSAGLHDSSAGARIATTPAC